MEHFLFGTKPIYCGFKAQAVDFERENQNLQVVESLYMFLSFVIMICEYIVYNLYFMAL